MVNHGQERRIVFLITAAGKGSRFPKSEWDTEKPLIQIDGRLMIEYAIRSLPIRPSDILVLALKSGNIFKQVKALLPVLNLPCEIKLVEIPKDTNGQAETAYLALKEIDTEEVLIIHNCDTAFNLPRTVSLWRPINSLLLFKGVEPRWSYAEMNSEGFITRTEEKKVISELASTGTYQFSSVKLFQECYQRGHATKTEFYIAPMYNQVLKKGLQVYGIVVDQVFLLGTPEDLLNNANKLRNDWIPFC